MNSSRSWSTEWPQPLPAECRHVLGESVDLPLGEPDRWRYGYQLRGVVNACRGQDDTTAPGALRPGSVRVSAAGSELRDGIDVRTDDHWGVITRCRPLVGPVRADYEFSLLRVDALVEGESGRSLLRGHSHLTNPVPPTIPSDVDHRANVFVPYFSDGRVVEYLPVGPASPVVSRPCVQGLRRWNAALERGRAALTCWGDSVTAGGNASSLESTFPARLQAHFDRHATPASVATVAVGGSNSAEWLGYRPAWGGTDWAEVAASRPDVLVVEFINDAGLPPELWPELYADLLQRTTALGADLVLCEPNFSRLDWMPMDRMDAPDPRPYVAFLRQFADRNQVSLAAVSRRWEALYDEGIPYVTLLVNGINHPDDRGHAIFAEEIAAALGVSPANAPNGRAGTVAMSNFAPPIRE